MPGLPTSLSGRPESAELSQEPIRCRPYAPWNSPVSRKPPSSPTISSVAFRPIRDESTWITQSTARTLPGGPPHYLAGKYGSYTRWEAAGWRVILPIGNRPASQGYRESTYAPGLVLGPLPLASVVVGGRWPSWMRRYRVSLDALARIPVRNETWRATPREKQRSPEPKPRAADSPPSRGSR